MRALALVMALALVGCESRPPPINYALDRAYADGLFGIKWGESIEAAEDRIGIGSANNARTSYTFGHQQDIFQATRVDGNWIQLMFGDAGLHTVRISFPSCIEVGLNLSGLLGAPQDGGWPGNHGIWRGEVTTLSADRIEDGECVVTIVRALPNEANP